MKTKFLLLAFMLLVQLTLTAQVHIEQIIPSSSCDYTGQIILISDSIVIDSVMVNSYDTLNVSNDTCVISSLSSGNYFLKVFLGSEIVFFTVYVPELPAPSLNSMNYSENINFNSTGYIQGLAQNATSIELEILSTNSIYISAGPQFYFNGLDSGQYKIILTSPDGCQQITFIEINLNLVVSVIQTRLARWCDGQYGQVFVTSNKLIDSIKINGVNSIIKNDSTLINISSGDKILTIFSGFDSLVLIKTIQSENSWDFEIPEIIPPTCSFSNDGKVVFWNIPENIFAVFVDSLVYSNLFLDTIRNLSSGQHEIRMLDDRGCKISKYINIPISLNNCISYPDAFSPNGDGVNDIWKPIVPEGTKISIEVWTYKNIFMQDIVPKLIFEGENYWDGSSNNNGGYYKVDDGYYIVFLTIEYSNMMIPITPKKLTPFPIKPNFHYLK